MKTAKTVVICGDSFEAYELASSARKLANSFGNTNTVSVKNIETKSQKKFETKSQKNWDKKSKKIKKKSQKNWDKFFLLII